MLYIHIPFCRQACHYCNFHFSTSLSAEDEVVSAILIELDSRKTYLGSKALTSVYFGGGTPSILKDDSLRQIFDSIHKHFEIEKNAEITFEANPEDINKEKLEFWHSLGINRLSIGIQSYHEEDLQWMNRIHSAKQSEEALDAVEEFGKMEYSLDLIFGSETTSNIVWEKNLSKVIKRRPSHISCYALTVEENTALHHFIKKGTKKDSPHQKIKDQFYLARKLLMDAGYSHYEISNYSLENKEAAHNSNYWKSKHYLGIGPSAHSYNGTSRSWNLANNAHYIDAIKTNKNAEVKEVLSLEDQYNEFVMTRLRTKWGIKKAELESLFQENFVQHFYKEVKTLIDSELIEEHSDTFTLSEKALIIADSVSSDLFF